MFVAYSDFEFLFANDVFLGPVSVVFPMVLISASQPKYIAEHVLGDLR